MENNLNIQGTEAGSVTEGLPVTGHRDITDHMRKIRKQYGFDSPIGHRCSNIIEILEGLPRHPSEWIDYLMPDWVPQAWEAAAPALARQMADYRRLMAS